MNQKRLFGVINVSSSQDATKMATTIEGIIKAIGGIVAFWGVSTITGDINSLADQAGQLVTLGYAFYGVAETAFGLLRKLVNAFSW